ncbi:hypothetical protein, partial [Stutzerimonas stutzeri]|uniref:hypothetical protein n=1 Tax=Stutzerimonas stutzeri TaxID=316 RepID=UPI0021598ACD
LLKSVSIKPFVSTEAAHSTAALYLVKLFLKNFSFFSTAYAVDQPSASRQREANSTAFKAAVNHLFQPLAIEPTEAPTGFNYRPVSPAHSTRICRPCKPLFLANLLIYKRFYQGPAPEKVRIIGPQNEPSTSF